MKSLTLTTISDKLLDLADKQAELYPKFYEAELKYISIKSRLMREQYQNFGSQPSRDAAVNELLELTPEYVEYHKLYPEMQVHEVQTRIYLQLARNLTSLTYNQ